MVVVSLGFFVCLFVCFEGVLIGLSVVIVSCSVVIGLAVYTESTFLFAC